MDWLLYHSRSFRIENPGKYNSVSLVLKKAEIDSDRVPGNVTIGALSAARTRFGRERDVMGLKIYPAILLLGCSLCFNSAKSAATSADHLQPSAQEPAKAPHRVQGKVPFSYDYAEALNLARRNGKPIFAYFTYAT